MKRAILNALVTIAALLFIAGCQGDGAAAAPADTLAGMIQSFIVDFARQSLAAFLL